MVSEKEYLQFAIKKFLALCLKVRSQKTTSGLNLKEIGGSFHGFRLKAAFGSGNLAKRPAIAFLKDENKVNKGIYPIIVFVPEANCILTCKGVSTDFDPPVMSSWIINDNDKPIAQSEFAEPRSIKSYLRNKYLIDLSPEDILIELIVEDMEAIVRDYRYAKSTSY